MNLPSAIAKPLGYQWLLDRNIIGYEPFTPLQPWHYLRPEQCFWASERWPNVTNRQLLVFAKRQDCDDLACFIVEADIITGVAVIHGWTGKGYDISNEFDNFWDWVKFVIDDISVWAGDSV